MQAVAALRNGPALTSGCFGSGTGSWVSYIRSAEAERAERVLALAERRALAARRDVSDRAHGPFAAFAETANA